MQILYSSLHNLNMEADDPIRKEMDTIAPVQMPQAEIYGALPALPSSFTFTSGVGGWADEIWVNSDGSFTGTYYDSETETGEGYPYGTEYICEYSGQFTNITKISDLRYTMDLQEIMVSHADGEQWINNGIRYISSGPYGINGSRFTLYLPGTTRSDYPAAFEEWYYGYYAEMLGNTLNHYALVNETTVAVFWGD